MTKEQNHISRINHANAVNYFKNLGLFTDGMILHHIDWTLKANDIDRYIQWNVEDLIPMTKSEHVRMHNKGEGNGMYGRHRTEAEKEILRNMDKSYTQTEAYRQNMSKVKSGEGNGMYGRKHTEESRKKMSDKAKGRTPWNKGKKSNVNKHWFNNGVKECFTDTCPDGFVKGRLSKVKRYAELTQMQEV